MKMKGITRVKGKQFRYIMPLTKQARKMLDKSTVKWTIDYPKEGDLEWKKQADEGYEAEVALTMAVARAMPLLPAA